MFRFCFVKIFFCIIKKPHSYSLLSSTVNKRIVSLLDTSELRRNWTFFPFYRCFKQVWADIALFWMWTLLHWLLREVVDPRLSWSLRVGLEDFIYNLAASSLCFLLRLQPGCEKLPQVPAPMTRNQVGHTPFPMTVDQYKHCLSYVLLSDSRWQRWDC